MNEKNELRAGPFTADDWRAQELANAKQAAIHFRERAEAAEAKVNALPELVRTLESARLQIEYLHDKFAVTGTGNAVLAEINAVLAKVKP